MQVSPELRTMNKQSLSDARSHHEFAAQKLRIFQTERGLSRCGVSHRARAFQKQASRGGQTLMNCYEGVQHFLSLFRHFRLSDIFPQLCNKFRMRATFYTTFLTVMRISAMSTNSFAVGQQHKKGHKITASVYACTPRFSTGQTVTKCFHLVSALSDNSEHGQTITTVCINFRITSKMCNQSYTLSRCLPSSPEGYRCKPMPLVKAPLDKLSDSIQTLGPQTQRGRVIELSKNAFFTLPIQL